MGPLGKALLILVAGVLIAGAVLVCHGLSGPLTAGAQTYSAAHQSQIDQALDQADHARK